MTAARLSHSEIVQGGPGLGTLQPTLVADGEPVSPWCDIFEPELRHMTANKARLGKSSVSQVFPLRFESDVALVGGPITEEVPGFMVFDDFKSRRTKIIA